MIIKLNIPLNEDWIIECVHREDEDDFLVLLIFGTWDAQVSSRLDLEKRMLIDAPPVPVSEEVLDQVMAKLHEHGVNLNISPKNLKLFEFIYEAVVSEGGRGDLTLFLRKQPHRVVAAEFERFLESKDPGCWERNNMFDRVDFSRGQELIVLTNEPEHRECFQHITTW